MRKLIFIGFVVMGALVGLLSGARDDWGTRVVMMGFGALAGTAVGGGLMRMGSRPLPLGDSWLDRPDGNGAPEDDLIRNYWRDRGHPPFMKPPEGNPDKHMFDPDKLG